MKVVRLSALRTGRLYSQEKWAIVPILYIHTSKLNLLALEFYIYIIAHPVCKMRIIQEPKKGSIMK